VSIATSLRRDEVLVVAGAFIYWETGSKAITVMSRWQKLYRVPMGTYGSSLEALGTAQIELQRAFDNVTEAATQGAKMKAGMETQSKASDTSDMV